MGDKGRGTQVVCKGGEGQEEENDTRNYLSLEVDIYKARRFRNGFDRGTKGRGRKMCTLTFSYESYGILTHVLQLAISHTVL